MKKHQKDETAAGKIQLENLAQGLKGSSRRLSQWCTGSSTLPGVSGGFASVQPGQIFGGQPPPPFDPDNNRAMAMASDKQHQLLDPRLGRIKRRAAVGTLDDDEDNVMGLLRIQSEHRILTNTASQLAAQIQPLAAVAQQLQPLAQAAPALVSIVKEWQPLWWDM